MSLDLHNLKSSGDNLYFCGKPSRFTSTLSEFTDSAKLNSPLWNASISSSVRSRSRRYTNKVIHVKPLLVVFHEKSVDFFKTNLDTSIFHNHKYYESNENSHNKRSCSTKCCYAPGNYPNKIAVLETSNLTNTYRSKFWDYAEVV